MSASSTTIPPIRGRGSPTCAKLPTLHPKRLMLRRAIATLKDVIVLRLKSSSGHDRRISFECLLAHATELKMLTRRTRGPMRGALRHPVLAARPRLVGITRNDLSPVIEREVMKVHPALRTRQRVGRIWFANPCCRDVVRLPASRFIWSYRRNGSGRDKRGVGGRRRRRDVQGGGRLRRRQRAENAEVWFCLFLWSRRLFVMSELLIEGRIRSDLLIEKGRPAGNSDQHDHGGEKPARDTS
jgi:hypothetical protein